MFLAQLKEKAEKKGKQKRGRLHPSAAQHLVASQETDGHFDAQALAFQLARVWEKLMPAASMPTGGEVNSNVMYSSPALKELSVDPIDATVLIFNILLFLTLILYIYK